MAGYVISSGVPYGAYLRERSSFDDLTTEDKTAVQAATSNRVIATIKDSSAQLIASQEALRSQNIELLKATKAGFQQMAWDVQQTTAAVRSLDATFSWGFNSILTHAGRMSDTLESLLVTAKTPSKTRAYEHFDDGRKAFDRGHLPEALEQIDKAISGDHTSAGYKLEWRFHLLRGAIQVGTFSHPQLLDLPAAEESYLSAARYASAEDTNAAALALLGAGWACYCQGRLDAALTHTNSATTLSPSLAEGHFQASKILMALGRSREGLHRLEIAVGLDPGYVVKAAADGDFQNFTTEFEAWCAAEGERSRAALQALYDTWSGSVAFWIACVSSGVSLPLVASTIRAASPPLLDTLICLHALDALTRNLKTGSQWSAQEAAKAIETIPETLEVPAGLLQSLRDLTDGWSLDTDYFALGGALLKRQQAQTVAALCKRAHEREAKPLELFALWLAGTSETGKVKEKLATYLQQVPASGRAVLIADYHVLRKTKAYPPETLGAIRTLLLKRYDQWKDEIAEDLRHRAIEGTKAPLEGIATRAIWSMIAMTIVAVALQELLNSTNLSVVIWIAGVALWVAKPIPRRILVRKRRLRSLLAAESKVRRRLATAT
jgi:tetratricopeptide (TPR) repeat protein